MKNKLTEYLNELERLSNSTSHQNLSGSSNNKEEADFEARAKNQELKHKEETHKQHIENEQQNTRLRLQFANMVFWLTVWTLVIIAFLIVYSGISHLFKNEFLSDQILTSLIIFAGVDMLGIFSIILAYLFNRSKPK